MAPGLENVGDHAMMDRSEDARAVCRGCRGPRLARAVDRQVGDVDGARARDADDVGGAHGAGDDTSTTAARVGSRGGSVLPTMLTVSA